MTAAAAADEFRRAIQAAGLTPPAEIIPDGRLHRFPTNGRRDDDSGWYVLHDDGLPAGCFGDFRTDTKQTWHAEPERRMTDHERAAHRERVAAMQRQREAEEQQRHVEAARRAEEIWNAAQPAHDDHAYLQGKRVRSYGLRLHCDGRAVIPIYKEGVLASLEFIAPNGEKEFLRGGAKKGGSFMIGDIAKATVILKAEGYATAASLHQATGLPVVVAFDAGNLKPVAEELRKQYPAATIIVCGDNDRNQVGQKAAHAAAQAVNGLVAIPAIEGFDWNDMHVHHGLAVVKAAIEKVLEDGEMRRLAGLSPMEYGRARKVAAKRWGVPVSALDATVAEIRTENQADNVGIEVHTVIPSSTPIDGPKLAQDLAATIRQFIVLEPSHVDAVALWTLWAHAFFLDLWSVAPNLGFVSPEMRCGKTSMLSVLANVLDRPLLTSNVSVSAIFRVIEAVKPTLIIDEMDTFQEADEALRGVLNSGHTKTAARVLRVHGEKHEVKSFSTWGPKVFACIGALPPTVADRTIAVPMKRKLRGEQVDRLRWAGRKGQVLTATLQTLAQQCKRWVQDHRETLAECEPALPDQLDDRQHDSWFGLFAVAESLGGEWPERAKRAALSLSGNAQGNDSFRMQLLADLQSIIAAMPEESAAWSQDLCDRLALLEERPWGEFHKGKPVTTAQLARQLRPFGVQSRDIRRAGEVKKGYLFDDLRDVFERYISVVSAENEDSKRYSATTRSQSGDSPLFQSATDQVCSASENARNPAPRADCSGVAAENPEIGPEKENRGGRHPESGYGSPNHDLFIEEEDPC